MTDTNITETNDNLFTVDAELKDELTVTEKGEIKISAAQVKAAAKRMGLDVKEANEMQKLVNETIGVIANTAGQRAFDHIVANPEVQQVRTTFTLGQTSPILTVNRDKEYPLDVNDRSKGMRVVNGQSRLDMRKSMPENFRKNIQKSIQGYAETTLGDGLKK